MRINVPRNFCGGENLTDDGRNEREMSQYVREWVMTIVFLVAASAFFEGIFPGGSMGKYLKYIFALIILSVILSPVAVIFG